MSLYKQHPDGPWWVNITHAGERIRRTTGTYDRQEAQRFHDELKAKAWKTTPKLKGKTWGMAVLRWCELKPRSESDLLSLRKFAKHFPDRLITQVTREAVDRALIFCKSAGTYMRYRATIMAVLNVAKDEGWLQEVPKLATRNVKTKVRQWITKEQWRDLYEELPTYLKPMAAFALATGLRQANVLGLTWDRVDLERRVVIVEGEETKSGDAISVPLNDDAVAALRAVAGQHAVWCFTYRGKPIKKVKRGFSDACLRAGIPAFTWHGLRHTWATWHIQAGTPIDILQQLGSWADLRMVQNYAHHSPGHIARFAGNSAATPPAAAGDDA